MGDSNRKSVDNQPVNFSGKTQEALKAEMMNRDYLHAVYGDELAGLNREVRYTRTAYLRELMQAEEVRDREIRKAKRKPLISAAVCVFSQIFTVIFYELSLVYRQAMVLEMYAPDGLTKYVRAYYAAAGFCGTLSWIILLTSVLQLLFFLWYAVIHIRQAKKVCRWTVQEIENKKRMQMIDGTYDASC